MNRFKKLKEKKKTKQQSPDNNKYIKSMDVAGVIIFMTFTALLAISLVFI